MNGKKLTLLSSGEYSDYRVTDVLWVPDGVDATKVSTVVYEAYYEVLREAEHDASKIRVPLEAVIHERLGIASGLPDNNWLSVEEACKATLLAMDCELAEYTETWIGSV